MIDEDRQLCSQCEYDITGIAPPGRLVRCPECGADNRIGHVDLDAAHMEMPPWWFIALSLGWPGPVWTICAIGAWASGDGPFITGMAIIGGVMIFVACARAAMLAFDCSSPARRGGALMWTMFWALGGTVGLTAIIGGGLFSMWTVSRWLEALRSSGP